jgi:hypothetical protein
MLRVAGASAGVVDTRAAHIAVFGRETGCSLGTAAGFKVAAARARAVTVFTARVQTHAIDTDAPIEAVGGLGTAGPFNTQA